MRSASSSNDSANGAKLGPFKGVFVPTLCSTLGVVVFLRMGFVVGQAGLGLALLMATMGFTIAALTMGSLIELVGGDGTADAEYCETDAAAREREEAAVLAAVRMGTDMGVGARLPATDFDVARNGVPKAATHRPRQLFAVLREQLGADLGDTIGVVLFIAYCMSVAFYTLGFAEATRSSFDGALAAQPWAQQQVLPWNPAGSWVSSLIATGALLVLLPLVVAGTSVSVRGSIALLTLITGSLVLSLGFMLAATSDHEDGFTAFSWRTLRANWGPNFVPFGASDATWRPADTPAGTTTLQPGPAAHGSGTNTNRTTDSNFWVVFGIFFPGFTGILGGANLNFVGAGTHGSELAQPRRAFARGIRAATRATFGVYVMIATVLACTVDRTVLQRNLRVMETIVDDSKAFGMVPVVFVGVCAATLSSALSYLIGAPRVLQALADGGTIKILRHFRTPPTPCPTHDVRVGGDDELRSPPLSKPAVALTWLLVQLALLTGTVDLMAPVVTGLFLLTFCVINMTALLLTFRRKRQSSPSANPNNCELSAGTSKLTKRKRLRNRFLSVTGLLLSFGAMFTSSFWWLAVALGCAGFALLWWRRRPLAAALQQRREYEHQRLARKHDDLARNMLVIGSELSAGRSRPDADAANGVASANAGVPPTELLLQREERILRAAMFVRDALRGRFHGATWGAGSSGLAQVRAKRMFHRLSLLRTLNLATYLMLPFVLAPSWCAQTQPSGGCGDANIVLNSRLPVLSPITGGIIELLVLLLFCAEMELKRRYKGTSGFFRNHWHIAQLVLLVAAVSAALVSLAGASKLAGENEDSSQYGNHVVDDPPLTGLLLPLLRPIIFVSLSRRVRGAFASLVRIVPAFADCVMLLALLVAFFAMFGMLLFEGTAEGLNAFPDLATSSFSLLILLTTANFPDVMLPAYRKHRASALFFVVFLLIGLFFLMNLVLATIYNAYRKQLEDNMISFSHKRQESLQVAFGLLDLSGDGYVEVDEVESLIRVLEVEGLWEKGAASKHDIQEAAMVAANRTPSASVDASDGANGSRDVDGTNDTNNTTDENEVSDISVPLLGKRHKATSERRQAINKTQEARKRDKQDLAATRAMLHKLVFCGQVNERRGLAFDSFSYIFSSARLQHLRQQRERDKQVSKTAVQESSSPDERNAAYKASAPAILCRSWMQQKLHFVRTPAFEVVLDAIVILNAVLLFDTVGTTADGTASTNARRAQVIERAFVCVYVAELALKIAATKIAAFFRSKLNCFDAFVIIVSCAFEFSWAFGVGHSSQRLIVRVALLLRLLRLTRVVVALKRFNTIFTTYMSLLPAFATMFGMLFAIFNIFAEIGIAIFGGRIYKGAPALNGTMFEQSGYEVNNFNDYGSACMTLFELLVVNNWQVLMEGFVAVRNLQARWFFILFYGFSVVMLLNLIVAFVLDAFFRREEERRQAQKRLQVETFAPGHRAASVSPGDTYWLGLFREQQTAHEQQGEANEDFRSRHQHITLEETL